MDERAPVQRRDAGFVATPAETLWRDPAHWGRFGVYSCAADSRLLVPARGGLGWTVNMAHRHAQRMLWSVLGAVLVFVAGLVVFVMHAT